VIFSKFDLVTGVLFSRDNIWYITFQEVSLDSDLLFVWEVVSYVV